MLFLVLAGNRAYAAQPATAYTVLAVETRNIPFYSIVLSAFEQGLKTRSNGVAVDISSVALTGDDKQDTKELDDKLKSNPRLILTLGTDATLLVAGARPNAPVVFSMILNPISLNIVQSLSAPGGRFTGTTLLVSPGKQFETLQQILPNLKAIGVLYTANDPTSVPYIDQAEEEAKQLGIGITAVPIPANSTTNPAAIDKLAGEVGAIWLIPDPASMAPAILDVTLHDAMIHHIPVLGDSDANVRSGALMALSANTSDMGDLDAQMAIGLLQGADPAQMSVRGPRRMTLSINLQTAQQLGITIPDSVLRLADEVINASSPKS